MAYQQDELSEGKTARPAPSVEQLSVDSRNETDDASTDQIRRDIKHTRTEMDQTLDALGERLRPMHLLDDLVKAFRPSSWKYGKRASVHDSSSARADYKPVHDTNDLSAVRRAAMSMLREHPVPAAMIGAGVAFLIYEEVRGDKKKPSRNVPSWSGSEAGAKPATQQSGSADTKIGQTDVETEVSGVRDRAAKWAHDSAEKVSDAWDSNRDAIAGAAGAAGGVVDSVRGSAQQGWEQVRHFGEKAKEQMNFGYEHSRDNVKKVIETYPISMAAAATALGVVAGLLLPGTDREDNLMGDASRRVKDQVKSAGHEALERGKQLAFATADAAAGAAQEQGLTPGTIADKLRNVADEVGRYAAESASRGGLGAGELGDKVKRVAEQTRDTVKDQAQSAVADVKQAFKAPGATDEQT